MHAHSSCTDMGLVCCSHVHSDRDRSMLSATLVIRGAAMVCAMHMQTMCIIAAFACFQLGWRKHHHCHPHHLPLQHQDHHRLKVLRTKMPHHLLQLHPGLQRLRLRQLQSQQRLSWLHRTLQTQVQSDIFAHCCIAQCTAFLSLRGLAADLADC